MYYWVVVHNHCSMSTHHQSALRLRVRGKWLWGNKIGNVENRIRFWNNLCQRRLPTKCWCFHHDDDDVNVKNKAGDVTEERTTAGLMMTADEHTSDWQQLLSLWIRKYNWIWIESICIIFQSLTTLSLVPNMFTNLIFATKLITKDQKSTLTAESQQILGSKNSTSIFFNE